MALFEDYNRTTRQNVLIYIIQTITIPPQQKETKQRDTGTLKIFLFTLYLQIINRIIVSDLRKVILK